MFSNTALRSRNYFLRLKTFQKVPAPTPALYAIRYIMSHNLHIPTCCSVRPCPCSSIIHWGYQLNWLLGRFKNSQPIAGSRSWKLNHDYGSGSGKSSGSLRLRLRNTAYIKCFCRLVIKRSEVLHQIGQKGKFPYISDHENLIFLWNCSSLKHKVNKVKKSFQIKGTVSPDIAFYFRVYKI